MASSSIAGHSGSGRTRLVQGGRRRCGRPAGRCLAGGAGILQERALSGSLLAARRRLETQDLLLLSEHRDADSDQQHDDDHNDDDGLAGASARLWLLGNCLRFSYHATCRPHNPLWVQGRE